MLAFSPDSTKLACGGRDGQLFLVNAADGNEIGRAPKGAQGERILAMAFSHDGSKIATGSYDTTCSIWRVPDLAALSPKMEHRGHVWAVAFSPDDSLLAAAADDNTAQFWNMPAFERAGDALPHQSRCAPSPSARTALLCLRLRRRIARVWQLGGDSGIGQPMQTRREVASTGGAARRQGHRDGERATATSGSGTRFRRARSRMPRATAPATHFELAFNPAGTVLVTAAHDGTIRLWNGATLEPIGPVIKMTAWVRAIAISPDGTIAGCRRPERAGSGSGTRAPGIALAPLSAMHQA